MTQKRNMSCGGCNTMIIKTKCYRYLPFVVLTMILVITNLLTTLWAQRDKTLASRVTGPRPLYDAAELLEALYAKPVTYEDPILVWSGDIEPSRVGAKGLYPKERSFTWPTSVTPEQNRVLSVDLLEQVLRRYHEQTDGPRFTVRISSWGLHIVPSMVRNSTGIFVNAISLLDNKISIPVAKRTPTEHFQEICSAISRTAGIKFDANPMFLDQLYAVNGIVPTAVDGIPTDKALYSFLWGAKDMKARDAVISLLGNSATTVTWRLLYQPGYGAVFSLLPIRVSVEGPDGNQVKEALRYDRCKKCPSLFPPAPPPPVRAPGGPTKKK